MKIAVVGTGYVGLVTGTCFSETGNKVTCIDIDQKKVEKLSNGEITIYEPGLEKIFLRNLREGRLTFTTNLAEGVKDAEIVFLALPTPPGEGGAADLRYVLGVAKDLGKIMTDYKVLVDKSTVPVGTAEKVHAAVAENYKGEFDVVSNPEFLREGVAVDDFMKPDRVVVGTQSDRAKKLMSDLYGPFVRQGNPVIFMDEKSAELTKYAANSFLATKISFMNEIAQLCEKVGADVDMVRKGIGSDDRIGRRFLFPGIGYGGSCFPKDVQALIMSSEEVNYDFKILKAVEEVNEAQKLHLIPKIEKYFKGDLKGKHFALWGLAFKPNTDDIREAPALYLIDALTAAGATVTAYDPEAMPNVKNTIGDKIKYADSQYGALKNADALVIATEWSEFRTPDFEVIDSLLKGKAIFDGRNLFEVKYITDMGYHYESIGRH
ncbi:UDP-glucose/GDP-mannose dehydrogenase family protein [Sediminibacterium sp.]|jgi:UDPglucose 6-dehydrogenase|uniref:UDP-glucose dehydrogenase family protein n=1 Tax=Sediminibacterium sp. TaxID=1917865 RepID=UPI00271B3E06|nr:UDP-glucose/GDP-mannose dehydrogenase family protein [Sediminibacterium sp.]MDO8997016.1 UDP-glucose/GDP-mannose dehydrogenase family protein [Sediminibacterium sp.]MDO9157441.1 UDP-glucose/GDP-mannose dehydrogenase family protein [Sediminibacterium sp.]MDP1972502.1 UDP-glucose/GDP-mannose dehydrogenase family protein [Sediminibacterium sp.]MDP2421291.1 UDP-glucose/GDP-mannose dehydrogenase family protein [Sediminibacterium sp.]